MFAIRCFCPSPSSYCRALRCAVLRCCSGEAGVAHSVAVERAVRQTESQRVERAARLWSQHAASGSVPSAQPSQLTARSPSTGSDRNASHRNAACDTLRYFAGWRVWCAGPRRALAHKLPRSADLPDALIAQRWCDTTVAARTLPHTQRGPSAFIRSRRQRSAAVCCPRALACALASHVCSTLPPSKPSAVCANHARLRGELCDTHSRWAERKAHHVRQK